MEINDFIKATPIEDVNEILNKFEKSYVDAMTIGCLSVEKNPYGITLTKSIYIDEQD